MKLTTDWQDTGIIGPDLPDGIYLMHVEPYEAHSAGMYIWWAHYGAIVSWYAGQTNSAIDTYEIPMAVSAHAFNQNEIKCRLKWNTKSDPSPYISLQIMSTKDATDYIAIRFSFRKLI